MSGVVRPEVDKFVALGPLPSEVSADQPTLEKLQRALEAITPPVSTEEAKKLMTAFGPDDCYGFAWTLLHLIETSPELPFSEQPPGDANEWVRRIWDSAHR